MRLKMNGGFVHIAEVGLKILNGHNGAFSYGKITVIGRWSENDLKGPQSLA